MIFWPGGLRFLTALQPIGVICSYDFILQSKILQQIRSNWRSSRRLITLQKGSWAKVVLVSWQTLLLIKKQSRKRRKLFDLKWWNWVRVAVPSAGFRISKSCIVVGHLWFQDVSRARFMCVTATLFESLTQIWISASAAWHLTRVRRRSACKLTLNFT